MMLLPPIPKTRRTSICLSVPAKMLQNMGLPQKDSSESREAVPFFIETLLTNLL